MKIFASGLVFILFSTKLFAQFIEVDELDEYTIQYRYKDENLKTVSIVCVGRRNRDTLTHLKYNSFGELDGLQILEGTKYEFVNGNPVEITVNMPVYSADWKSVPFKFSLTGEYDNGTFTIYKKQYKYKTYVDKLTSQYLEQFNGFYYPIYRSEIVSFSYVMCGKLRVKNSIIEEIEYVEPDSHRIIKYENGNLFELVEFKYYYSSSIRAKLEKGNWLLESFYNKNCDYFLCEGQYHPMISKEYSFAISNNGSLNSTEFLRIGEKYSSVAIFRITNYNSLRDALNRYF